MKKHAPVIPGFPHLIHGADYNPDQWQHMPEIIDEDFRMMPLAGMNSVSLGIFSWTALEPEEGQYTFAWMDDIMDRVAAMGGRVVLATPSGARPAWMSEKYPEVLRVRGDELRNRHGVRHNHCYTSPVYREKTRKINTMLAERYRNHPALGMWHVSNEFSGECFCPLCREAFRAWVKNRYQTLDALNKAWWTAFWSHTYTRWEQVEPPVPHGETQVHGLNLDWRRFCTDQTADFIRNETAPLRSITPQVPVTANMMYMFEDYDYQILKDTVDVISWDSYPEWHKPEGDAPEALRHAFCHDWFRAMKQKPFMLMECTPSLTNWQQVSTLKKPGMHKLASLQALAHGADTIQYFQWRKSRGSAEKFHGAVVDHAGHENTRVFREVAGVGQMLTRLDSIAGSVTEARVAVVYDTQNSWAIRDLQGMRKQQRGYLDTCMEHYRPFWEAGIPVDVIGPEADLSGYALVIAPMMYMVREGFGARAEAYVREGGHLVATYWSGVVDEHDLCFLGGFPGPLRAVLGIWSEESDALHEGVQYQAISGHGNTAGLSENYSIRHFCDLVHPEGATVHAVYGGCFYEGMPVLTENQFGRGTGWYIAARCDGRFHDDFYGNLIQKLNLKPLMAGIPAGVQSTWRTDGETDFIFLMNWSEVSGEVPLPEGAMLLEGVAESGVIRLEALSGAVVALKR